MIDVAERILLRAKVAVDVRAVVGELDFSKRQLVEIARACLTPQEVLGVEAGVVLLDEPTASLQKEEERAFFDMVASLREHASVLFVSHRLSEVLAVSDRLYVLKDGRLVADLATAGTSERRLHALMVGRERDADYYHEGRQRAVDREAQAFAAEGLTRRGHFSDVSFTVRHGEILGIGGLLISGKEMLGKVLAGVVASHAGQVRLGGGRGTARSPAPDRGGPRLRAGGTSARGHDRRTFRSPGTSRSPAADDLVAGRFGIWRGAREQALAAHYIDALQIRGARPGTPCRALSGGNQQKVVLARWLCRDLKVLILDNPTRGVDAGAKEEIYGFLRALTERGVAIVLITDELLELIGLSNRIAIMRRRPDRGHDRDASRREARRTPADRADARRPGDPADGRLAHRRSRGRALSRAAPRVLAEARWRQPVGLDLSMGLPLVSVVLLVLVFSIASDAFLSLRNFTGLTGQVSTLLLACLGASFVILMGSIDLSVGACVLLVGAVTVKLLNAFDLGVAALLPAVLLGAMLGALNGAIHAYGVIPSFVVTLGSLSIFTGLAWEILQGRALRFDSIAFENLAIGQLVPHLPNIFLFAIGAWAVMVFINFKTRFGRYIFIIGGGEAVARTAGIPVRRYKIYAFALSGALAGLAGALAVARLGAAGPTLGQRAAPQHAGRDRRRRHVALRRRRRRAPDPDRGADHRAPRQRPELDGGQPVCADGDQGRRRHPRRADRPGSGQDLGDEMTVAQKRGGPPGTVSIRRGRIR